DKKEPSPFCLASQSYHLKRDFGESWGLSFPSPLFDGIRTCVNACSFCFLRMLPKGLRPSLYLPDDDYRLSFLSGNFVTLSNLSDADLERIVRQHLSPLHVSLHAIDPDVRQTLMGHRHQRGLEALMQLVHAGIQVHTQIVLLPEVNDGEVLQETLVWAAQNPNVLSTGIVPYAYTRFAQQQHSHSPEQAAALIDELSHFAPDVQLADAWFVLANRDIPNVEYYGDFPQYENGIGMIHSFLDEWQVGVAKLPNAEPVSAPTLAQPTHPEALATIATSTAFAPYLEKCLAQSPWSGRIKVQAIVNNFFGGCVDVAGLLTAEDLIHQYDPGKTGNSPLLLPESMFNDNGLTLDDYQVSDLEEKLKCAVYVVPCSAELLLQELIQRSPKPI
ncbi:MAG: DUF512 domain-containing protein, partial [Coriobacteriales bacterium]|nr:DUF512 domain-containing protein [Coriobacteriales bacterium]